MRIVLAAMLVAILACAAPKAARRPNGIAISEDGRSVVIEGETWRAPEGVVFFQRDGTLHVVSLVPGSIFDVRVALDEAGRPVEPTDAPFAVRSGTVRFRNSAQLPAGTARLVDGGQLYRHDEHFHLTHRYENEDWQALYRAREDDSPFPPVMRQVAGVVLATVLDMRIPGSSDEAMTQALHRVDSILAKARHAVDVQAPAKQVMGMVLHDFEISEDGKSLSIEGRTYRGEGGVRFSYCGDHFHVEAPATGWTQAVALREVEPGRFDFPRSVFFSVENGNVTERSGDAPWRELLAKRQIHVVGDAWFVTEQYPSVPLAALKAAAIDEKLPAQIRDRARASLREVLPLRLDVDGDAEFRARLASIEQALEHRWRDIERDLRAVPAAHEEPKVRPPPARRGAAAKKK